LAKSKAILDAVKAASGASSAEILSTKLVTTRRSTSSRALLATTVEAEVAVGVDTAEAAQAAAGGLSAENLNEALAAVGVPAATVLVAPTIDAATGEVITVTVRAPPPLHRPSSARRAAACAES
jgi:hypothetical protein